MHNNFLQYSGETAQELKGAGSHVCTQIPTKTQLTL